MIEIVTTLSSKNQVTIPKDVRERLGIGASDKVSFVLNDEGTVELRRPRYTLDSILGSIRGLPGQTLDLDREIEEATAEEIARKFPLERRE